MFTAIVPKGDLLNSWGQWVRPTLCLKAFTLLSLLKLLDKSRGTIVTVIASLTSWFRLAALKGSLGWFIFPPWMVRESKRIKSPALHYTNCPVPMRGSLFLSSTQSELLPLVPGYLSTRSCWQMSLLVLGTTCSPPAPSAVTSMRGSIPCTHLKPFLW